ncbi:MAG TPA: phosphonate ABC transporter ATP-binding protein, partial [Paraburkholderia sp.]|nr:phosphonate ABC transporter ATP-binding protein [Paraburkholderia sp.]
YCPRTIAMRNGKVVYDGPSASLTPALLKKLYGDAAHELLDAKHASDDAVASPSTSASPAQSAPYAFTLDPAPSA